MKLSFPRLVAALALPILGAQNGLVHGQFNLKAEDGPHEAVWLQVSFYLEFPSACFYSAQHFNFFGKFTVAPRLRLGFQTCRSV